MASSYTKGGLGFSKISSWKALSTLEQTAWGRGWVTMPEGILKTCRCGTYKHSLVVALTMLDPMILKVFSNLDNLLIPALVRTNLLQTNVIK